MTLKLNVVSLEEKVQDNGKNCHDLYLKRQAFDDTIIELQLLGNHFLDEALDNPEMERKNQRAYFPNQKNRIITKYCF